MGELASRYHAGQVLIEKRCAWADTDPLNIEYHDAEWRAPEHDDRKPFETLIPGGAQTGLGWLTVPRKRDTYLWGPVGGRTKKTRG